MACRKARNGTRRGRKTVRVDGHTRRKPKPIPGRKCR